MKKLIANHKILIIKGGGFKLKLNRMFIVSILLLAILTIGAVSASEEISDDVAAIEPTDDVMAESVEAEEISQSADDDVSQELDEAIIDSNVIADTEDDIRNDFDV